MSRAKIPNSVDPTDVADFKKVQIATPQQRAIIESNERSIRVRAAAGAGKTFILVERYMRHVLEEGIRPDQILTITFTRKAAANMKRRIVQRLREAGRFDDAQVAETGPIQTIHSFCERLLRENALAAALDPKFDVAEGERASEITLDAIREALGSSLDEEPHALALLRRLTGRRKYRSTSAYALVEDQVAEVLSAFRSSGRTRDDLRVRFSDVEVARAGQYTEIVNSVGPPLSNTVIPGADLEWVKDLRLALKETRGRAPGWLRSSYRDSAELQAAEQACGLAQLALAAWWRVVRTMEARQELDFSEMEARAERLLVSDPHVAARMQDQYRVVMVDEAQDVNPIQYRLLDALGIERELWVGDDRQSIYGFRQADVDRFRRKMEGSGFRLSKNHRSVPGILRYVDSLFGRLWSADYEPMQPLAEAFDFDAEPEDYAGVEHWHVEKEGWRSIAGHIQELLEEGHEPKEIACLVRRSTEASKLLDALSSLGIPARIQGGADRFYTRLEVRDLANALRAVADPNDDFSLLAMLRSPMVGISLDSLVQLASKPGVFEQLTDFVASSSRDEEILGAWRRWFVPLSRYADRLSAWEVLAEIFALSGYIEALARRPNHYQTLANVRKLLTLAAERPEDGPIEYAEHIREIQNLNHKEGDAPAGGDDANEVVLLTIHKAKGLEYPVVVLPGLYAKLSMSARECYTDPRFAMIGTKIGKEVNLPHEFLKDTKQSRELAEEYRVLYVGMTRAEKRLCLCLYPDESSLTLSKRIKDLMGAAPLDGVVQRGEIDRDPDMH